MKSIEQKLIKREIIQRKEEGCDTTKIENRLETLQDSSDKDFTELYNELMLANSNLSKLEREMIAVVVSSINRCFYCLTAHGAAVRELSGDPILGEKLVMNYRTADLDPRHRAMLEFAEKVTIESHKIDETDRQNLRDVGFKDADIWDITNIIAFFNMSNRVASALNMKPNDDYHAKAR